jgi:NifU-like protein involved in Fe-S cluster formation
MNARYSEAVWQSFMNPEHAGTLSGNVLKAHATDPLTQTTVALEVNIDDGMVTAMRYRVRGCPVTIACLEKFTTHCEFKPISELVFDARAWLAMLDAPIEKLTRLLVIEEAFRHLKNIKSD